MFLRNTNFNCIFLQRLPIQNHSKSSINEENQNKAKYMRYVMFLDM